MILQAILVKFEVQYIRVCIVQVGFSYRKQGHKKAWPRNKSLDFAKIQKTLKFSKSKIRPPTVRAKGVNISRTNISLHTLCFIKQVLFCILIEVNHLSDLIMAINEIPTFLNNNRKCLFLVAAYCHD